MQHALERARARRADEGFTLIELLIVIVILGILAAIVVFSVTGITDKGDKAACQASVETVDTAAEAYIANGGTGSVPSLQLGALAPSFLHSIPTKIGGTNVTSTTTVSQVDGITC